ncbi:MAG: hypothetical protein KAI66_13420, partial [Lentisphaeria bacterium]|nr:hypothetical protein [Lentisphaeria bacterium]
MRTLALALLFCVSNAFPGALLTAYRTDDAPTMDGRLDDACWRSALATSPFVLATADGLPSERTVARFAWDDTNLYVAIEAFEGMLAPALNMLHKVPAKAEGKDANVFSDDSVEVFLQPPQGDYYHFGANSGKGSYDGRGKGSGWDSSWRCASRRGDKSYVVEMSIPFADLGAKPEEGWRLNVTRHRPQAERELSTWCGLRGGFHQPEAFGTLLFADSGPSLGEISVKAAGQGFEVSVVAGARIMLEAELTVGGKRKVGRTSGRGLLKLALAPPHDVVVNQIGCVYRVRSGEVLFAESAMVVRTLAASLAELVLDTRNADAVMWLNGGALRMDGKGVFQLALQSGLNILAIEAKARGSNPAFTPVVSALGRTLPLRWRVADGMMADWQRHAPSADDPFLSEVRTFWKMRGFWDARENEACSAVAVIYVGAPRQPLFPKTDHFNVPSGSTQLLRTYLELPPDAPSEGWRLILEAPMSLDCTAVDAFGAGAGARIVKGGKLRVDGVKLRRHEVVFERRPGSGMELSICWRDAGGHTICYQPAITAGGTHDWLHMTAKVTAPKGAKGARPLIIKWQNRGYMGTFWVDNVVFRRADSDENLLELGTFDEPAWKRSFPLEGVAGSKCFKVVGKADQKHRQQACWVMQEDHPEVEEGIEYIVELDVKCEKMGSTSSAPLVGVLMRDRGAKVGVALPLFTYFEALGGSVIGMPRRSTVRILPALRDVRPKRARLSPCYYGPRFSTPEIEAAFAENAWKSGMTWTYGKAGNGVVSELAPRGLKTFWSMSWHAWQAPAGTREYLDEHPEIGAIDFKGKPKASTVCPTWLLGDSEGAQTMLQALENWILDTLNTGDYFGANWDLEQPVVDPPTFCVCRRCQTAFRAFAKLSATDKLDPNSILANHRAAWTDFRCEQNAQMAGRLRAMCRKANVPVEFSMYSGYQSKRTKEHYGVDWARLAPHLDFAIAGYGGGRERIRATVKALNGVPLMGG